MLTASSAEEKSDAKFLARLAAQIAEGGRVRQRLLGLYATLTDQTFLPRYTAALALLKATRQRLEDARQTQLVRLRDALLAELGVVSHLIQAAQHLGEWAPKRAIFSLYLAQCELESWRQQLPPGIAEPAPLRFLTECMRRHAATARFLMTDLLGPVPPGGPADALRSR